MSGGSQAPMRVVLGVSGSVAAIKFTELMGELGALDASVEVKVVLTESARRFVSDAEIAEVKTCAWCSGVYTDDDEWSAWRKKGDPVTHVELGKWADVLLVAPLSANTLAKFANGSCDNLLTCLFRAWDVSNRDKIVCMAPAMNTQMWASPFTSRHMGAVAEVCASLHWLQPISKELACGDTGVGAMMEPRDIAIAVHSFVRSP